MRWLVGARKAWMALGAVLVLALSHAQPATAQPAPARPAGVNQTQNVQTESFAGTWNLRSPDQNWAFVLTVNPNGTLHDDGGFPGRWTQNGANITMNFDIGTFYNGRIANGIVSGTYSGGGQGTFTGTRASNVSSSQTTNSNSLVGVWDTSSPNESWHSVLTVYADGTIRDDNGYTGRWTQNGDRITINFDVGTVYHGRLRNGSVTGTYSGGGDGDFVMRRR